MPPVGVSKIVDDVATLIEGSGIIRHDPRVLVTRRSFFHRKDITGTTARETFFDAAESGFITNMPGGGNGLPNDSVFFLQQVKIDITYGYNVAGAVNANGLSEDQSFAPQNLVADYKALLENGKFRLEVGDTLVVDDVHGLTNFSYPGISFDGMAAADNSAAAVAQSIITGRNGDANDANGYAMRPWFRIDPGKVIRAYVDWPINRVLVSNCVLKVQLDGTFLTMRQS